MYGLLFDISFFISLALVFCLCKVRKVTIAKYLIAGTILIAFWMLMEVLIYYVQISSVAVYLQKIKFISIMAIPPLYVLAGKEYEKHRNWKLYQKAALFFIPFLSLLSMITNRLPYRFMSDIRMTYSDGIPLYTYHAEAGFLIHTFYSYGSILYVCYIFLKKSMKSSKLYRRQSCFIFWGSISAFIINIFAIGTKIGPAYIDFTSISMLATLIVLYWGLFRLPQSYVIPMARELLVENIRDMAFIVDSRNEIIDINPAAAQFVKNYGQYDFERSSAGKSFIGANMYRILEAISGLKQLEEEGNSSEHSYVFHSRDTTFYYRVYQTEIMDSDQSLIGRLFMIHDITQIQEYVNSLKRLNTELMISDRVINTVLEGILITDSQGTIIRMNDAFEKMSGYDRDDLMGENPRILKSDRHDNMFYKEMWSHIINDGFWEGEIWDKKKDGEVYPKWMSITSLKQLEGVPENYIAVSTDISKIKKTEEDLYRLEHYDSLTGIPNRSLFYKRMEEAIAKAKDTGRRVALLFLDLDGFNVINDTLGHAAGDLLLKEVALRIKHCIYKSDTVSRFGGDEFTVILENIRELEYVKNTAEAIIREIMIPYKLTGRELTLGVSAGIALFPDDENTVEGLVRKADAALYDAKETGKGRYSFASEEIDRRNHDFLEMQIKLKTALTNNELMLYLQPQISHTEEGFRITGAETLIRWKTGDGQIVTPDKFIPIAESTGMIIPIGNWILEEVFRIDRFLKAHGISIKLAINVSSKQLENNDFASRVKETVQENSAQNIRLVVEITESFLLRDLERAIESMVAIQKLGIGIALDDFGTGFSSLNYLTRLPINYLKIDKSFIDDIANPEHRNLTPSIISMAKTLGLKTVAEGVETKEQVSRLLAEKCDELQGYYFSRPVPLEDFVRFYERFYSDENTY